MSEKIYPKGLRTFKPREGAPEFVKGQMIVTKQDFIDWMDSMQEHVTEYQGKEQLKFNILQGDNGLYFVLDTYKPQAT